MGNRTALAGALMQQQAGYDMQRERDEQNMRQVALDHAVRAGMGANTKEVMATATEFYNFLRGAKLPRAAKRKGRR